MKANKAPEKLYIYFNHPYTVDYTKLNKRRSEEEVEYTRTDAFIEKVINFLNYKLDDIVATRVPGTIIPHHVAKQDLIEEFKKYMKGE